MAKTLKAKALPREEVALTKLKPHPKNYRKHPKDQLAHIEASLKATGFYRNIVAAKDYTILAGHGVYQASTNLGFKTAPVVRIPIDPDSPLALKILAGDNEIASGAEVDDRALTELLKSIKENADLLGTGFDEQQLAALIFNTRPASEIADLNEANEWIGMPDYETGSTPIKLVIGFKKMADRTRFIHKTNLKVGTAPKDGFTWSTRWPWTEEEKRGHLRFEAKAKKK